MRGPPLTDRLSPLAVPIGESRRHDPREGDVSADADMNAFWFRLYNYFAIPILWVFLHAAAILEPKVRRGIRGRRRLFDELARDSSRLGGHRRIWFHSSSLGEFEQAKPIIAALREREQDLSIIVSFFSPSGYDHSRSYQLADVITYIPFDTRSKASRFLDLIKPDVAVMVRYDVWPNHLLELRRRSIPTFIANATLRPTSSRLLGPLRSFHHFLYENLTGIFTVSKADADAFSRFDLHRPVIQVIGDTRYDQVWQRREGARSKHLIPEPLLKGKRVLVVGSSWPEDEAVILPAFRRVAQHDSRAMMILVPHEPTVETLDRLEVELSQAQLRSIRFSDLNDYTDENVILVDSIGILMSLYQYAGLAYVGGSFRQGIHSVLEPAVYGIPVIFGPEHDNSIEALELVRREAGFVVENQEDAYRLIRRMFNDRRARTSTGNIALSLVKENIGATDRFLHAAAEVLK